MFGPASSIRTACPVGAVRVSWFLPSVSHAEMNLTEEVHFEEVQDRIMRIITALTSIFTMGR